MSLDNPVFFLLRLKAGILKIAHYAQHIKKGVIKLLEKTFVLIKPDGVERGLVGRIITKFEEAGIKIEDLKMLRTGPEMVDKLYPAKEDWLMSAGGKLLQTCEKYNIDVIDKLGTDNGLELGKIVRQWQVEYIVSGPIVVMILSGNRVIEAVRKLIGDTSPLFAQPSTIRGDFSIDSADFANLSGNRAIHNLVHASSSLEGAKYEISLWFGEKI